jgi:hypothetical protein
VLSKNHYKIIAYTKAFIETIDIMGDIKGHV